MSRRKPALRIGGGVLNRNTLYQKDNTKPDGLGLLGTYHDSDSEENTASASNQLTKAINNLDTKVADFLKEIDELEATDVRTDESKDESVQISYGNWQQCIDENTQHPYYWNTATDEVTWILPEEISRQLEQAKNSTAKSSVVETVETNVDEIKQETVIIKNNKESEKIESEPDDRMINDAETPKPQEIEKVEEEAFDIDVDAELDHALESTECKDIKSEVVELYEAPTQLNLELEVLRRGELPLSDGEEEDLLIRFETDILKLEEAEEVKRKNGTWKNYEKEIEQRKRDINLDKTKWREERLSELKKMRIDGVSDEQKENKTEIFNQTAINGSELEKQKVEGQQQVHKTDVTTPEKLLTSSISQDEHEIMTKVKIEPTISDSSDSIGGSVEEEISSLSSTILDKLGFIGISTRAFTNFHRLLIEIETRITDWRDGLLPATYVVSKLQAATQQLKTYEDTATPEGWSCHWDRTAKRYFYKNNETKKMQWQYPETQKVGSKTETEDDGQTSDTKKKQDGESSQKKRPIPDSLSQSDDVTQTKKKRSDNKNDSDEVNTNDMKDGTNSEQCTHPEYLQNYGSFAAYQQQGYASTPPPPGEDSNDIPPPLPSAPAENPPPPPPPPTDDVEGEGGDGETQIDDGGIMMEMSDDEDEEKSTGQMNTSIISQPILYKPSDMAQFQAPMMNYAMYAATNMTYQHTASPPLPAMPQANAISSTTSAVKSSAKSKIKKTKKMKKSTVVKKPAKGMTSLVAQWQKAKSQIEEEDRMLQQDDEEEVDQKTHSKQQIEKWKMQQISSGKSSSNSNFEPVPDDWRTRILKKKTKS